MQRIMEEPATSLDRQVRVEGRVVAHLGGGGGGAADYRLGDDSGAELRVLTVRALPPLESRWSVTGIIALDAEGRPYLVEATRIAERPAEGSAGGVAMDARSRGEWTPDTRTLLLGVLLSLGMALLWRRVRRGSRRDPPLIFAPPGSEDPAESSGRWPAAPEARMDMDGGGPIGPGASRTSTARTRPPR